MMLDLTTMQLEPVRLDLYAVDMFGEPYPVPPMTEYFRCLLAYEFNLDEAMMDVFKYHDKYTVLRFYNKDNEAEELLDLGELSIFIADDSNVSGKATRLLWYVSAQGRRGNGGV